MVSSARVVFGASGVRFGWSWSRCDRGKESYLPMASLWVLLFYRLYFYHVEWNWLLYL